MASRLSRRSSLSRYPLLCQQSRTCRLFHTSSIHRFEGHPDGEFQVQIHGSPAEHAESSPRETWLYQLSGVASLKLGGEVVDLFEGSAVVIPAGSAYEVSRQAGSIGMVVTNNPLGNAR